MLEQKIHDNLANFLRHIDSIRDTLPMTLVLIDPYNKKAIDDFNAFLKKDTEEIINQDGTRKYVIKPNKVKLFETLEKNAHTSTLANKIITESLFVSLISQYDAFLTRLLRIIYEIKPEILNSSERNLTYSQIVELGTIENAKEHIIEKEIDSVLRKSHSEHFDYLESKIKIKLRENLPIWKTFIEITERRNLLVHCDGIISSQYIKNCLENNCTEDNTCLGEKLNISPKYFISAYNCLYEIAVKLTHTLWRKLLSDNLENADLKLNDICFDLINIGSHKLADILLEFGYTQKHHYNEITKNIFIINKALSRYLQGNKEGAKSILDTKDWSASSDNFKLAYEILVDNYNAAYEIMEKIGNNNEDITKDCYKEWPLFRHIQNEKDFKLKFKEIFKEDFLIIERPMRPVEELLVKKRGRKKKKTDH